MIPGVFIGAIALGGAAVARALYRAYEERQARPVCPHCGTREPPLPVSDGDRIEHWACRSCGQRRDAF
jgi:tRNA(Ile2) C34 agmatinyltransferase TiaS